MNIHATRRQFLAVTAAAGAFLAYPALAQEKPKLRFSAVFSEQDIRAEMMKMFADAVGGDFTLEPYYGGNLFKQGTELVSLQRGNLEMGNISPQDVSDQIPAWSIMTAGYLFRDAAHLNTFFTSPAGAEMKQVAEDQLSIRILGPTDFGVGQVGLKVDREIKTPADMAGVKRMPGGDVWQFLGTALGADPTPMAYADVYTGLQTGAIDGQDNPLPNVENMKFYEVMTQIADLPPRRLRPPDRLQQGMGRDGRRQAGEVPGCGRCGHRLLDREAPCSRAGAGREVQGRRPQDLRARYKCLPDARPGEVSDFGLCQELARGHG